MTKEEAARILDPDTAHDALAEIEYFGGFKGPEAVRAATGEVLTLEQLRGMDGQPVWVTPAGFWALVIAKRGQRVQLICNDGEKVWADKEIELVGPVYAYPPAHIDREAWDDCQICKKYKAISFRGYRTREEAIDLSGKIHPHVSGGARFCPRCGKPRTPEAWAELKKRLRG